jgi:lysyl-tRNA synthetase class 2
MFLAAMQCVSANAWALSAPDHLMTDNWQPEASTEMLKLRAGMLSSAREFFSAAGVLEVETPVITAHTVSDPQTHSLSVELSGQSNWLRTSPEYHMKRLLAAHGEAIFQIGKVFRQGETGRNHQPEFTMIEWYRPDYTLGDMIDETCKLIVHLAHSVGTEMPAIQISTYAEIYQAACGLNPLTATLNEIRSTAQQLLADTITTQLGQALGDDRNNWLDLLNSHVIAPSFPPDILCVIKDYPADQAMLARLSPENPAVAERFEVFLNGIELANGFCELQDPDTQSERFAADNVRRHSLGLQTQDPDPELIAALQYGLPQCSGVALGFDRLVMLCSGANALSETLSFKPGS